MRNINLYFTTMSPPVKLIEIRIDRSSGNFSSSSSIFYYCLFCCGLVLCTACVRIAVEIAEADIG